MSERKGNESVFSNYFTIIQNVIMRMAQNSFLIKAWSVTIVAAIFILTYSVINVIIFAVLLMIIGMFWYLDSYYLKLERLFRRLYNKKVEEYNIESERPKMKLFDMNYKEFIKEEQRLPRIMVSKSELFFYAPFIIILIIFLIYSLLFL